MLLCYNYPGDFMEWYHILLIIFSSLTIIFVLFNIIVGYVGYKNIFKRVNNKNLYTMSSKSQYYPYQQKFIQGIEWYNTIEKEKIYITNDKGLKLVGKLTKQNITKKPNIVIFFHGWHDSGENEISCAGIPLLYKEGYDILIVDQATHGESEGENTTIGILEQTDVLLWVDKINEIYSHNCNIILSGMSMGANMVMLASNKNMDNVKGIIENCGFTNVYDVLKYAAKSKYNINGFTFSFVSMFFKIKTGLCLKEFDARKSLNNSLYPVLFIHGKSDPTVPYQMAIDLYNSCNNHKEIFLVEEAIHLTSRFIEQDKFDEVMLLFLNKYLKDS